MNLLLMIAHEPNLKLLVEFLHEKYTVHVFDEKEWLPSIWSADLVVVDGISLEMYREHIALARERLAPLFLPVLLVTTRRQVGFATRSLWKDVDEIALMPVERVELLARIESLLHARRLSIELHHRTQELEAFAQAAAHELRAPLRAIQGLTEAVLEDHDLPEEAKVTLHRVNQSSRQMKELLDALLRFAEIGKHLQIQTVHLDALLDTCLRELQEEGIDLKPHLQVHIHWNLVQADLILLKIVLTNLLRNAYQYASDKRRLQVEVCAARRGRLCHIVVTDNGIGMRSEEAARAFAPFVRFHEGTDRLGLGLALVKRAISRLGGQCGVVSTPDEGSTFWVELPASVGGEQDASVDSGQQSERP